MSSTLLARQLQDELSGDPIQQRIAAIVDEMMAQLPNPQQLTAEERRGIIARYSAVLEGNFIYWMTATFLAVKSQRSASDFAREPFRGVPRLSPGNDAQVRHRSSRIPDRPRCARVGANLTRMRLFLGRMQGVPSLVSMAFFETWIQRFMPFLAALAAAQGSTEMEYTDVHGVCDVAHSQELFRAVAIELGQQPGEPGDKYL